MTIGPCVALGVCRLPKTSSFQLLPARTAPPGFRIVDEPQPGENWEAAFAEMWPAYRAWWLKEGESARPDLGTCRAMLDTWMPELAPTFERLVELAEGDPLAARFLSMYRPPGFVVGCSQAAFTGEGGPVLVRNYDYPASRVEGIVYRTSWTGRGVIGMSDCLWGLLYGVNDAGLAASLAFGARPAVGDGFGIPLVIRYVLEVCEDVEAACGVLRQVPVHAVQNVTLIDRAGDFVQAFLEEPLHRDDLASGFGTLYTAIYFPADGRAEYRWPDGMMMTQSFDEAKERL